jgi:hypothetical protein
MTPENRKRVVLVILLGVLSITLAQAYRISRPQPAAALEGAPQAALPDVPAPTEGRIRLDLIPSDRIEDVGTRNLFQYGSVRSATSEPGGVPPSAALSPPVVNRPPASRPSPPPPPPIALKYVGFAIVNNGTLTAFISDDTQRYNVTAGEVLMGRFRVTRITTQSVEIEDIDFKRRQTLPLVQ